MQVLLCIAYYKCLRKHLYEMYEILLYVTGARYFFQPSPPTLGKRFSRQKNSQGVSV